MKHKSTTFSNAVLSQTHSRISLLPDFVLQYSIAITMTCGVPQGLILGLLLFNLYMFPLGQIIHVNNVAYYSYADDTQDTLRSLTK